MLYLILFYQKFHWQVVSIRWILHSTESLVSFPCHALKGGLNVLGLIEFRVCLISMPLK